jgi:hypothetical protein
VTIENERPEMTTPNDPTQGGPTVEVHPEDSNEHELETPISEPGNPEVTHPHMDPNA